MTAQVFNFPNRPFPLTLEALTDMKVRMVEYFDMGAMRDVKLVPVNQGCPYEKALLPIAQALAHCRTADDVHRVAETIFNTPVKGLTLKGFLDKIRQDDLIMACLQAEFRKLSMLDQLFLINVIKTKFPEEETAIEAMKVILFASEQFKLLDPQMMTKCAT